MAAARARPKNDGKKQVNGNAKGTATAVREDDFGDDELGGDDELEEEEFDDGLGDPELDDAFDPDAPISPIDEVEYRVRRALEAGQGSPYRLCIRALRKPGTPGANLQPVKGYLGLEELTAAGGSLAEAVRRRVESPGEYVVHLSNAAGKKTGDWERFVTVKPDEQPAEVRDVEVARLRTIARRKLLEEEAEMVKAESALQRARNGAGSEDRFLAVLDAVEARLRRLEERRADGGTPPWLPVVLASPLIAKLAERMLRPQSPTQVIAEIAPLMQTVMTATTQAQLEQVKSENKRTDVLLDHALQMLAAQAGVPPEEDDSVLGLASKVVDMLRPGGGSAPAPAAPVAPPAPAPAHPTAAGARSRPQTPFARFVSGALTLAGRGVPPEKTVERLLERWEAVPQIHKAAFLDPTKMDRVVSTLPDELQMQLHRFMQAGGQPWVLEVWRLLRELESPDDERDLGDPDEPGDSEETSTESDEVPEASARSSAAAAASP
ncbi:MAG: hypothetical protein ACF8XB_18725 [Planctomycetota bacterium JB042]